MAKFRISNGNFLRCQFKSSAACSHPISVLIYKIISLARRCIRAKREFLSFEAILNLKKQGEEEKFINKTYQVQHIALLETLSVILKDNFATFGTED